MKDWLLRGVAGLAACFIAVYGGDWAAFKMRGSPHSSVTVDRYLMVPLKGGKQEFDYLGSQDVSCSVSLFSQGDLTPCWQLRRNTKQTTKL